ncbi:MAG: hypothetical protein IKS49_06420 [Actinomycetaceae bacterium]|nr:hypothetical protein [Actinomycetaceae bacterium]
MGSLKRVFASFGLIAVMCVSGTALADEVDETEALAEETVATLTEDSNAQDSAESTPADESEDTATIAPEDEADSDGEADGDADAESKDDAENNGDTEDAAANPDGENDVDDKEDADASDSDSDGIGPRECTVKYHSSDGISSLTIGDGLFSYENDTDYDNDYYSKKDDKVREHLDLLAALRDGTYDPEKTSLEVFEELLKEFGKDFDLSGIHGPQTVTVFHGKGSTCLWEDGGVGGSTPPEEYTFTVYFPIVSENPPTLYRMSLYFDDKILDESQAYVDLRSDSSQFDTLVALNGKEVSVDEFLKAMNELGANTNGFPKVGGASGKHTVKFGDFESVYSVVTVVYPEKGASNGAATQGTTQPQANSGTQQTNSPAANPQAGNTQSQSSVNNSQANAPAANPNNVTVVRASDMSYRQFLGNSNPRLTPIAPAPAPAPSANPVPSDNPTDIDKDPEPTDPPTLPVTGDKDKKAAKVVPSVDEDVAPSHAALFALAACLGFGIVAAVAIITIRRMRD